MSSDLFAGRLDVPETVDEADLYELVMDPPPDAEFDDDAYEYEVGR